MSRLPKLNKQHQFKPSNDDFLLGDIDKYSFENILLYSLQGRKIDNIDKTNCFETHGFDFLNEFLDSSYYMFSNKNWTHNTFICAVLHLISPKFSLLKTTEVIDDYIFEFRKQMGLDIDEKSLSKKLDFTKNKIKRKLLQEILFRNQTFPKYNIDTDDDLVYVAKYICLRFKIGLLVVDNDKNYKYIIQFPNRLNIILLKNNNKYFILCNTNSESNLFSNDITNLIVQSLRKYIITKLNDIKDYKVDELKVIATKLGLNNSKNKSELYEDIKNSLS
jgi:hypothetical protein